MPLPRYAYSAQPLVATISASSYFLPLWKCVHGVAAAYLHEFCIPVETVPGRPRLWSASTECIHISCVVTSQTAEFCFPLTGSIWNSLPRSSRARQLSVVSEHFKTETDEKLRHHKQIVRRRQCSVPGTARCIR